LGVSIVVKWLREARKTGIRVVILSTGKEVRTLGVEGQGSVRENFLFVRLGTFALDVADVPPHVQYPAALIRGSGKQEPLILDTHGLPSLIRDVPPVAVWQPVQGGITTTAGGVAVQTAPPSNSNTKRDQAIALFEAGESLRSIQKKVFGYAGGAAHDKVEVWLREAGLL
jgi:hypothetical protein